MKSRKPIANFRSIRSEDNGYMALLDNIRELVKKGIKYNVWTLTQVSVRSRLAPRTISRFLNGDTVSPNFWTLYRLCTAVGVDLIPKRQKNR
jgi:hypothetical protein